MKYKIEGNIDFFGELYKSLDESDELLKSNNTSNDDTCLITNKPLTDRFVKLDCGHKFNYVPLFNDILNHKTKFNNLKCKKLQKNEIRCPYCRNKQTGVLPYYADLINTKINGVNCYIDENTIDEKTSFFSLVGCHYTRYSKINDTEIICGNNYVYNFDNNKHYCSYHYSIMNKLLLKEKNKETNKKIKEEAKKAKIESLNKLKEEKKKIKDEIKKKKSEIKNTNNEENTIIEPLVQVCCIKLKKGTQCCKNIYLDNLCKRHYNLKNKEQNEIIESNENN